jgi:TPR repeat protein
VKRNLEEANVWYRKALDLGSRKMLVDLAEVLWRLKRNRQELEEALRFVNRAEELNTISPEKAKKLKGHIQSALDQFKTDK